MTSTDKTLTSDAIPAEYVAHHVEPGTVYDDEPTGIVPPGWYVLGGDDLNEATPIIIKVDWAEDNDGNDISELLANRVAALLKREYGQETADDATVERVAASLADAAYEPQFWINLEPHTQDRYRRLARAAIAALLGGES